MENSCHTCQYWEAEDYTDWGNCYQPLNSGEGGFDVAGTKKPLTTHKTFVCKLWKNLELCPVCSHKTLHGKTTDVKHGQCCPIVCNYCGRKECDMSC